jgi:predicted acylesterase/phospholipase RssA
MRLFVMRALVRRALLLLALASTSSCLLNAQQLLQKGETAWSWPPNSDTASVVFSFSGGISLGAYQAGVNWAIVEFLKKVRDNPAYRAANDLPYLDVTVMTGASAGNINVLLGSIEYCDSEPSKSPQSSLFWKMWVLSGWNELSPEEGARDPKAADRGVLDRGSAKRHVLPAITSAMQSRTFSKGCRIPLGIVMTRINNGWLAYDRNIRVENQRYVTMVEMQEMSAKLRMIQVRPKLMEQQSFGAQAVLPADYFGLIHPDRVFDVVQASSAYPVAFAPNLVTYQDPTCVLHAPTPPGCTDTHKDVFMDGGVFDNNPVSLALGMQRVLRAVEARPRVIYVDPGATRGALANAQQRREAAIAESRYEGIDALLRFASGFIPVARKYELQSFIREKLGEPDSVRPWIQSSTRAHPVVGEYFNAFGAFFGRPFREFDFYDGVSDGLRYVAYEILCDPSRLKWPQDSITKLKALRDVGDTLPYNRAFQIKRDRCANSATLDLARAPFGLDSVGKAVVIRVLSRELPGLEDKVAVSDDHPNGAVASERERLDALDAVEKATYAQINDQREYVCPSDDLPERLLCSDGFGRVLDSLSNDGRFTALIDSWAESGPCNPPKPEDYDAEKCLAEHILKDFMHGPRNTMQGIIDRSLYQMRAAEEDIKSRGKPDFRMAVKTVEFVYRSGNHKSRRGWDMDPSSIPPHDDKLWQIMHFLPYYVGSSVGTSGTQVGWEPTVHFGWKSLIVKMPFELDHLPVGYDRFGKLSWYPALTPSVGRDFAKPWLNQLAVGGRTELNLGVSEGNPWVRSRSPVMPEISVLTLMGKVRVAAYRVPVSHAAAGRALLRGTVSLADVNGLLYWVLR